MRRMKLEYHRKTAFLTAKRITQGGLELKEPRYGIGGQRQEDDSDTNGNNEGVAGSSTKNITPTLLYNKNNAH